jgi:hypothetical protein
MTRRVWTCLAFACAWLCASLALAATPTDTVIVLDSSGSMKQNDPRYRAHLAAQIYADVVDDVDALAILSMDPGRIVVHELSRASDGRQRAKQKIKKLGAAGGTHCVEALSEALAQLSLRGRRDAQAAIVFLSDGECPETARDGRTTADVLRAAAAKDVRIFSIGLGAKASSGAGAAYLARLASATGGHHYSAQQAEELPGIFAQIFGRTRGTRAYELDFDPGQQTFTLEPYVSTAAVVLTPAEGGTVDVRGFQTPAGRTATGVAVVRDQNRRKLPYVVAKLRYPDAGAWQIDTSGTRRVHMAVMQTFGLDVTLDPLPSPVPTGSPVTVVGRVTDEHGKPIDDKFAGEVEYDLHCKGPGDKKYKKLGRLGHRGGGEYQLPVDVDEPGRYACYGRARRGSTLDARTPKVRTRAEKMDVKLDLARPDAQDVSIGADVKGRARVLGADGEPSPLAEKFDVTLEVRGPRDREFRDAGVMKPGKKGRRGSFRADKRGTWEYRARAKRGDQTITSQTWKVRASKLDLEVGPRRLDLGKVKAGDTVDRKLRVNAPGLDRRERLRLDISDRDAEVRPRRTSIGPGQKELDLVVEFDEDHPGGKREEKLTLTPTNPAFKGHGEEVVVTYEVEPLTFWERWGTLILWGLGLLLALIVLAVLIHGFASPHEFSQQLSFFWGESLDRFKRNQVFVRQIRGARRGFYRNAKFTLGGPKCAVSTGGPVRVTFEATGAGQVTITAAPGVELLVVNKFDPDKTTPLEGGAGPVSVGQVFKTGELFFKLDE